MLIQQNEDTVYTGYPRFEGANIGTWIGFKHVYFFLEEALLAYFRERSWGPQYLFQKYGLCFDIVACKMRLLQTIHIDDIVHARINLAKHQREGVLTLAVQLLVERDSERQIALKGTISVLLLQESGSGVAQPVPETLAPYVHNETSRNPSLPVTAAIFVSPSSREHADDDLVRSLPSYEGNTFVWRRRIPYFYCHYSKHIQHSGYIRFLEEVVDLFLADRSLSIRTMLESRNWIPIVLDVRTEIRERAFMEETMFILYTVEDILKDVSYTARMDCYVIRNGEPLLTATSWIMHGYAEIKGHTGSLAHFDTATITALQGKTQ